MQLWTIQLAQWRKVEGSGIVLVDTTAKSGIPAFAPQWEKVSQYKSGLIDEVEYTLAYLDRTRQSYRENPGPWLDLIATERVAIACYCGPGKFCHRHILKDILQKLCAHKGIPFVYQGEL